MPFTTKHTKISGVFTITPSVLEDDRGYFYRVFCIKEFNKVIDKPFVQINHSYNKTKGTFRGLHYQEPPYAEGKLIRCIKGSICDIIVDLRKESKTFLQHIFITLSAISKQLIYIPEGCAHGFLTLENDTELIYHHTNFYNPEAYRGISIYDKKLNIILPFDIDTISEKDKNYSPLPNDFEGLTI